MSVDLRYLGVSGVELVDDSGTRVVIDPMLSGSEAHGLPASPVHLHELLETSVILVTHGAWDHLGDAVELAARSGAPLVCAPEVRLHVLASRGLRDEQVVKIFQGCERSVEGVTIKALHAEHVSFVEVGDQWLAGPPLSYLVDLGGTRVFHAGDTALFGDLRLYGDLYRPDLALLGVGATESGLAALPPEEAALAADWLGAPVVIPMHYPVGSDCAADFAARAVARRPDITVVALEPGAWYRHGG